LKKLRRLRLCSASKVRMWPPNTSMRPAAAATALWKALGPGLLPGRMSGAEHVPLSTWVVQEYMNGRPRVV
jgi:hypothetical protein